MTTGYFSSINQAGIIINNNYDVYIALGVGLVSTNTNSYANTGYGVITNYGALIGSIYSVSMQTSGTTSPSILFNAQGAIISAPNLALYVGGGGINITNYGEIGGTAYQGISIQPGAAADVVKIVNTGTIEGSNIAYQGGVGKDQIVNSGVFRGAVQLSSGGGTFDSSLGQVFGTITAGSGGDTITAGQNGGTVIGSSGSDVLYANPTQTAANNASQFILDGKTGNNWLYGGGASTTFDSGDNSAGTYNQIFGGKSEMANVTGYTNNTVSYAGLANDGAKSVYVDLINGDTYKWTATNASGASTSSFIFEDYLQNVPNVIGSNGGDVIFADNAIDQITGGKGADTLYAGTGSGSQDTFKYGDFSDSLYSGFDYISGFKVGTDKVDLSALNLAKADITLSYGGSGYNSIYVEHNPSQGFNAATDMFIYLKASTNAALSFHDLIG